MSKQSEFMENQSNKTIAVVGLGYVGLPLALLVISRSTGKNLGEAVKNAQAVIIATAHKVFKELTPEYFLKNGVKVVVDGRNCLPKEKFVEAGIVHKGMGR